MGRLFYTGYRCFLIRMKDFKKGRKKIVEDHRHLLDPLDKDLMQDDSKMASAQVIYKSEAIYKQTGHPFVPN